MAFTYKILVSPAAYEQLYREMVEEGESSVKATIRRLLVQGAGDSTALEIARGLIAKASAAKGETPDAAQEGD